jgi:hypothetical protein
MPRINLSHCLLGMLARDTLVGVLARNALLGTLCSECVARHIANLTYSKLGIQDFAFLFPILAH